MSDLFDRLIGRIANLEGQLGAMRRQVNNMFREAQVLEVDEASGMAIVDAQGGKSKPVPWMTRAGAIRDWDPVEPGERVLLLSPNGDPGRAMILPGGYSGKYGQPHNKRGESMRMIGGASDLFTASQRVIESQLIILRGTVKIEGPLEINGSKVSHNGKNIGSDHIHRGVRPGGGTSGPPR